MAQGRLGKSWSCRVQHAHTSSADMIWCAGGHDARMFVIVHVSMVVQHGAREHGCTAWTVVSMRSNLSAITKRDKEDFPSSSILRRRPDSFTHRPFPSLFLVNAVVNI